MTVMKFTRETAKQYSGLANQVRWSRYREKLSAAAMPANAAEIPGEVADDYASQTMIRVRSILDGQLKRIVDEDDPNKIDRLASAISKLAELDRQLSGRPLPGTLKPTSKPPKRNTSSFPEPIPCEPGPLPIQLPIIAPKIIAGNWEAELF